MMGALAAAWARGIESAAGPGRRGAAAGAANFLRHGLGSGARVTSSRSSPTRSSCGRYRADGAWATGGGDPRPRRSQRAHRARSSRGAGHRSTPASRSSPPRSPAGGRRAMSARHFRARAASAARGEHRGRRRARPRHVRRRHLDQRARLDAAAARRSVRSPRPGGARDGRSAPGTRARRRLFDGSAIASSRGPARGSSRIQSPPPPSASAARSSSESRSTVGAGHLAAAGRPGRDPRPFELAVERGHPRRQSRRCGRRGRGGCAEWRRPASTPSLSATLAIATLSVEVEGAVVDAGEQVAVQVDHRQASPEAAAGRDGRQPRRVPL